MRPSRPNFPAASSARGSSLRAELPIALRIADRASQVAEPALAPRLAGRGCPLSALPCSQTSPQRVLILRVVTAPKRALDHASRSCPERMAYWPSRHIMRRSTELSCRELGLVGRSAHTASSAQRPNFPVAGKTGICTVPSWPRLPGHQVKPTRTRPCRLMLPRRRRCPAGR